MQKNPDRGDSLKCKNEKIKERAKRMKKKKKKEEEEEEKNGSPKKIKKQMVVKAKTPKI